MLSYLKKIALVCFSCSKVKCDIDDDDDDDDATDVSCLARYSPSTDLDNCDAPVTVKSRQQKRPKGQRFMTIMKTHVAADLQGRVL